MSRHEDKAAYYRQGLKGDDLKTFEDMLAEMDHLTTEAQREHFTLIYMLDPTCPRHVISAATEVVRLRIAGAEAVDA